MGDCGFHISLLRLGFGLRGLGLGGALCLRLNRLSSYVGGGLVDAEVVIFLLLMEIDAVFLLDLTRLLGCVGNLNGFVGELL
jgi:hypothetical protein